MRKILLSLLLATTVATPALAQRPDREDRANARQEHKAERSEARQERSEPRQEQRAQVREERVQVREEAPRGGEMRQRRLEAQQMQDGDQQVREVVRQRTIRDNRPAANVNERGRPVLEQRQDMRDSVANWRGDQRDLRQQRVEQRTERNRVRIPVGARPDRPAPAPETAARDNHYSHWRTDWRHDRRYDWRNYRHHHRSTFRLGIYIDPFGWGYHRYNIGWRMWPSFYSSNYWLNDPYMYRLPYAPWPFKWVRYYDDALLVNVMTGQVVDVMYDFFW
jgi:Ni/Co efflux regulator RcnB